MTDAATSSLSAAIVTQLRDTLGIGGWPILCKSRNLTCSQPYSSHYGFLWGKVTALPSREGPSQRTSVIPPTSTPYTQLSPLLQFHLLKSLHQMMNSNIVAFMNYHCIPETPRMLLPFQDSIHHPPAPTIPAIGPTPCVFLPQRKNFS